jgi:hypothetical protein
MMRDLILVTFIYLKKGCVTCSLNRFHFLEHHHWRRGGSGSIEFNFGFGRSNGGLSIEWTRSTQPG